jgi:hypothetical protein
MIDQRFRNYVSGPLQTNVAVPSPSISESEHMNETVQKVMNCSPMVGVGNINPGLHQCQTTKTTNKYIVAYDTYLLKYKAKCVTPPLPKKVWHTNTLIGAEIPQLTYQSTPTQLQSTPQTTPQTILVYNTTQGPSVVWDGVTFTLNSNLPNYSYIATISSTPATPLPFPDNLIRVTIGNIVRTIGDSSFENCTSLETVTIPNTVTTIDEEAFKGCTSLKTVTIPNSVTTIHEEVFQGCTSLKTVTIPNSVTTIRDEAFKDCTSLKRVTIPTSVTSIGQDVFSSTALEIVYISNTTANLLGNQFTPLRSWNSPSANILDFYGANSVEFRLPLSR